MKVYRIIGLMSGTSLDGLDIAYANFHFQGRWRYKLEACHHVPYPEALYKKIMDAYSGSAAGLMETDHLLGEWTGLQVKRFIAARHIEPELVVSHGQTIFHRPDKGYTVQIGSGWSIWKETGVPVVADLRSADMALGGQGAPLVSAGDDLLFGEYDFCLNLGGFSNVSYRHKDRRVAFDIGPVNIVLNLLAKRSGETFDAGGALAASGKMVPAIFKQLNALSFYHRQPPKSLGMEWVEKEVLPLMKENVSPENLLHTFTRHAAFQIARVLKGAGKRGVPRVLVTGGGTYNDFLIKCLSEYSEGRFRLVIPDRTLIDYKEALVFAFLGLLKKLKKANVYACVTGAARDTSGGVLFSG